ncbi:MAG TPA: hypothetical protein PLJ84_11885, partial [Bacteroidales bacterium]|nr:hypothetical protein [Bacteroidales bacterium]
MKTTVKIMCAMLLLAFSFSYIACEKSDSGSNLKVLTGPSGENQTIAANIDDNGVLTFNAQMLMA